MATRNTMEKARKIQELTAQHYEPGRQDRCKLWVYRNIVNKIYPMSDRTFFRYLAIDVKGENENRLKKPE